MASANQKPAERTGRQRPSQHQKRKAQRVEDEILGAIARQRGVSVQEARQWMRSHTPAR